jgi:hypothetical protein
MMRNSRSSWTPRNSFQSGVLTYAKISICSEELAQNNVEQHHLERP